MKLLTSGSRRVAKVCAPGSSVDVEWGMERRLTLGEYEDVMVRTLRYYLIEKGEISSVEKIQVEEIRLNTSEPHHMLEIFFRDDGRPECLFAWRYPVTDLETPDDSAAIISSSPEQAKANAETFVLMSLIEQIEAVDMGLPAECDPEGITWVGKYSP